jgi:diketogulonate reductase-like aldo/keto reductase
VSNFTVSKLKELLSFCTVPPVVNQVELHPYLYQHELITFCQKNNIIVEAYSPLGQGLTVNKSLLKDSVVCSLYFIIITQLKVIEIAKQYNKAPSQVLIRWSIQHHLIPIVRSENPQHIAENINVFDFDIAEEDMHRMGTLNQYLRYMAAWVADQWL